MPEDMEEGSSPTLESASSAAVGTVDEASLPGLRLSRPVQSILAALDSCAEHSTAAACERLAELASGSLRHSDVCAARFDDGCAGGGDIDPAADALSAWRL